MKLFSTKRPIKSVTIRNDIVAVATPSDAKSSFSFALADVVSIKAIRCDLITEDMIGLRFRVGDVDYDIYEEVEGFSNLWREVISRYKPDSGRVTEFQRLACQAVEIELWTKSKTNA